MQENIPAGTIRGARVLEETGEPEDLPDQQNRINSLATLWDSLARMGLGDQALRLGTNLLSIILVLLVIWAMSAFYINTQPEISGEGSVSAAAMPEPTPSVQAPPFQEMAKDDMTHGITRMVDMHTDVPSRPRMDVSKYTVVTGDTIISIAEKFGLNPKTILWGNYYTLADNVERMRPGMELNILPTDGTYYEWHTGDKLTKVASFFGVAVEDIINWPGNNLPEDTDIDNPSIQPGAWLIVPGGTRQFISWSAPEIPRDNPTVAQVVGPGYCKNVVEGAIGSGTFVWPTEIHKLSGYDFSPDTNHWGIDLKGNEGVGIFAVDNGVVVYAGWNDHGYGNMIVIDHGNGFQTLYAHLNGINVACGQSVWQTNLIGTMGNTGNSSGAHLHFEIGYNGTKINPWNVLPPA